MSIKPELVRTAAQELAVDEILSGRSAGHTTPLTRTVAAGDPGPSHQHRDRVVADPDPAPVFPIGEHVPAELAALAEPLACVVNATRRANLKPGDSAVVFGAGSIGCLFVAVLRAAGARPVIAVEPSVRRREVAKAVGADAAVTPEELSSLRGELLPAGGSIVVDAVGSLMAECVEMAAVGGRIVLFGMNDNASPSIPQSQITRKCLTVTGTYITEFTFPVAIDLIEKEQLHLAPLVTDVLPLEQTAEGISRIRSGEAIKVIVVPEAGDRARWRIT